MDDRTSVTQPAPEANSCPADKPPTPMDSLDVVQLAALGWLMEGKSIRAAAEEAGVSRDTVSRWIRRDTAFRAAYNAWREELIESTRARLLRTAEAAAAAVHKAIAKGDGRLALSLLKHLDLASSATAGPTDPDLVEGEIAILEEEQRHRLHQRAFAAGNSHLSPTHFDWKMELQQRCEKRAGKNTIDPPTRPASGGNGEVERGA